MRLGSWVAPPVLALAMSSHGCGTSVSVSTGSGATPPPTSSSNSVVQHHNDARRSGLYVQPTLTRAVTAGMRLDTSFNGVLQGNVYAQPLYAENGPGGKGAFFVVTENDSIYALDETTGNPVWTRTIGAPAPITGAGCGNISPLGITGTPYIDVGGRTIYLDAATGTASGIDRHLIHALSIDDGSERSGWPVDPSSVSGFNPVVQNQRGALIVVNNVLYVPYGGHDGDCGNYRGWVIGVPISNPAAARGYSTSARGGGSWAPGGLASDGTSIFAATGNTIGATTWAGGEAILRLAAGPVFSGQNADYFTPSNWRLLDQRDLDLGGSGPVLIDASGANPSALVVALSKSGVAYLLDRSNLGGVGVGNGTTGEGVFSTQVATGEIINAAAAYTTGSGSFVVFHGHQGAQGSACPSGQSGDLVALRIIAGSPPQLTTAWCVNNLGQGSPIVTTTDGRSEAIVWTAGAQSSSRLHAWDAETGAVVFAGGGPNDLIPGVRRFTTPIAVKGRIFVGADNHLFAFRTP